MRASAITLFALALLTAFSYAQTTDEYKERTPLGESGDADVLAIPGVSIDCVILQDDTVQIVGTNSTNKSYSCDLVCNLKTTSGNDGTLKCSATLPANTVNGVLCSTSEKFSSIVGGTASCK
jgi:hypothetical protein